LTREVVVVEVRLRRHILMAMVLVVGIHRVLPNLIREVEVEGVLLHRHILRVCLHRRHMEVRLRRRVQVEEVLLRRHILKVRLRRHRMEVRLRRRALLRCRILKVRLHHFRMEVCLRYRVPKVHFHYLRTLKAHFLRCHILKMDIHRDLRKVMVLVETLLHRCHCYRSVHHGLTMDVVVEVPLGKMVPMEVRKLGLHRQEFPILSELDEDHPVTNELAPASG
jgi:hypothetical protein